MSSQGSQRARLTLSDSEENVTSRKLKKRALPTILHDTSNAPELTHIRSNAELQRDVAPVLEQIRRERKKGQSGIDEGLSLEGTTSAGLAKERWTFKPNNRRKVEVRPTMIIPERHRPTAQAEDDDSDDVLDILSSQTDSMPKARVKPTRARLAPKRPAASKQKPRERGLQVAEMEPIKPVSDVPLSASSAPRRFKPKAVLKPSERRSRKASTSQAILDLESDAEVEEARETETVATPLTGEPSLRLSYGATRRAADALLEEDMVFEVPEFDPSIPLCPFCDEVMPKSPSKKLKELLEEAKKKARGRRRSDSFNPEALLLPYSDLASVCGRHREETDVIPQGVAAGYPQTIDWSALEKRLKRETGVHLSHVIHKKVPSIFLDEATSEWHSKGRAAMRGLINHLDTFENELPGYYGFQGFELFIKTFEKIYLEANVLTSWKTAPLDPHAYVRRVLVPEAAVLLMSKDHDVSRDKAIEMVKASRAYGIAQFSDGI